MFGKTARVLGATAVATIGLTTALTTTASAGQATGTVNADGGLISRIAPSRHAEKTFTFTDGSEVSLNCKTVGTAVEGNTDWYLVNAEGEAHWVSANYVDLNGKEPTFCGADPSKTVTLDQDTQTYAGPSTTDERRRSQHAGGGQQATCFVYTGKNATERWVVTLEDGWAPAEAFTSIKNVPYCEAA